jgi:hypothetical protein
MPHVVFFVWIGLVLWKHVRLVASTLPHHPNCILQASDSCPVDDPAYPGV